MELEQQDQSQQPFDKDTVPEEIKGFNFGAFVLTWLWAFKHEMLIVGAVALFISMSLFSWAPFLYILGLPLKVYVGFRGNEMAWKARPFQSVQQFKDTQRVWSRWGIYAFSLWVFCVSSIVIGIPNFLRWRDIKAFTKCVDALEEVKSAEEMYEKVNHKYTDKTDYLTMYAYSSCKDPKGEAEGCVAPNGKNPIEDKVASSCSLDWKLVVDNDKFLVTGNARNKNSCQICAGASGHLPKRYEDCWSGSSNYDKKCSHL